MGASGYVEEFLHEERAAGKAQATLRNRRAALLAAMAWLGSQGETEQDAASSDLVGYLNTLVGRYTPDHVNNIVSGLRLYFRWLAEEGLRSDGQNPAARLKFLRAPAKLIEALTGAECKKLVKWATRQAPRERFGAHRTGTLALLLLDTGLRLGEALRLKVPDLDFEEGKLLVRKTKTGDFRVVPLSPTLRKHLRRYLARREKRLVELDRQSEHTFVSESGASCSVAVAEEAFRRVGQAAGIRRAYPHLLRHTFASQSLLNGAPLPAVMRLGGWRKLSTVQRYTYINDAVAVEVHSRTSPLVAL
ncbi:MAG TPA: tyrosine-type recombinase/integrase [Armatimonadota bacterium]|nr:tyrosine-type recombinase/integrase [Armatimonadota bacterium]